MTETVFAKWLDDYLRPQEQGSAEKIKDLFAADGVYWYGPFFEARHGVKSIYEHHRNALSHQMDLKYEYEILAVKDQYGIAKFHLVLNDLMKGEPTEYDGIFLIHLNQDNKCTLFQEWYHKRMCEELA